MAEAARRQRICEVLHQATRGLSESSLDGISGCGRCCFLTQGHALETLVRLPVTIDALDAALVGFTSFGDRARRDQCQVRREALRSRRLVRPVGEATRADVTPDEGVSPRTANDEAERAMGLWRGLQLADARDLAAALLHQRHAEMSPDAATKASLVLRDSTAFIDPSRTNIACLGEFRRATLQGGYAHVAAVAATGEMVLLGDCYGDLDAAEAIARETRSRLIERADALLSSRPARSSRPPNDPGVFGAVGKETPKADFPPPASSGEGDGETEWSPDSTVLQFIPEFYECFIEKTELAVLRMGRSAHDSAGVGP